MKRRITLFLLALLLMITCIPANSLLAAEVTFNDPTLVVESKYAASGTSAEVNMSVANNPGIAGAKISVSYSDKLTLVHAVSGDTFAALDYTAPPDFISSCYFNWDSLDTEVAEDGVLLTLVFEISPEAIANEELNVEVTYCSGDIYNIDLDSVELDVVNGGITIINYIPGDINGDNVLNGKDVTLLRRYNAGYNVTINVAAADTNNDGVINGKDVTLIRRHNAGYNVELKPSTQKCNHTMETIAFKAATCTEDGNISYYHCTACDKYYNDSNGTVEIVLANTILSATGHTWGKWENQSQTTLRFCTNDCGNYQGITSIIASYNGSRLLTGESVLKKDVSVTATLDDGSKETITDFELEDSVMTKDGNNIVIVDFLSLETTVAVPAIYDNLPGTTAISEFEYTVKNDAVTITKFVGNSTDIVIPAHIDRVPVRDIGYQAFYGCSLLENITIPDSVTMIGNRAFYGCKSLKSIIIPSGVKTIGEYAFYECTRLQSVTIGDNAEQLELTKIGSSAFQRCTSLKQVVIGNGVGTVSSNAFSGCTSLELVSLGDSASTLGYQSFNGCVSLKSINLSDGIVTIDGRAFYGCELLVDITFSDKLTTIGDYAFYGCKSLSDIDIPANVKMIGECAFYECTKLKSVVVGDKNEQINPTTIEMSAFRNCTSLKNVTIGNGVNAIPQNAFYGCAALESVSLGSNITSIGYQAFVGCNLLEGIKIPDSVTAIADRAFYGCKSLTSIVIPASVKRIGENAFYECTKLESAIIGDDAEQLELTTIGQSAFRYCSSLKQVTIGNGVGTVSSNAFNGCTSLERISLGDSVSTLGYQSFNGCVSLKSINLSDGIVTIDGRAFYGCELLVDITFGDKLTTIGDDAFRGCKSLSDIDIPANVKMIGECAFYECTKLKSVVVGDKNEQINPTTIEMSAFRNCTSLKNVTIGNGVNAIPQNAFYGCAALESVSLGSNITSIGYQAFYNCTSLATINYAGSEETWNSIAKDDTWDKNTGTYTVKYNCNIEVTETYTVTFKDYDGSVLKTQSGITKGTAAIAPANPTREGYTFAGWDKSFDNVTSDMVVAATYTPVASGECTHTNKTFVDNLYEDITYIDATTHSVKVTSQYRCPDCKVAITDTTNAIIKTEAHVHDFVVNGGWVCRCGHIQDVAFEAYTANLQSDVNRTTYYDPELTIRYGTVYVSDEITVIGSTDNAYLIKYPLDAGGYKFAFIAKKYIDKRAPLPTVNTVAINDGDTTYNNSHSMTLKVGDHNYNNGYTLTVNHTDSTNWIVYTGDSRVATTYRDKDGLVYIHANALGTTKLYISHIYVPSFSDLRAADCIEICEITVQKPNNNTQMAEDLAEAVIMPYLYDYLGAESGYDQVSEPVLFILEVMAKGIFGTTEFEISKAVRNNKDIGLDGGRDIIHEMVMNELLSVNGAWDVFLEEFADLMDGWSKYADALGSNYAFGKKEACIVGAIGNLTDSEYIILLDGNGGSDWYDNKNVRKAWQTMVDNGLTLLDMQNDKKMDAYRSMSKKFSNRSLKFFECAGKALSQVGGVVNLAEQYGSYLLLACMQDEVDALIDSWIAATDNAELIAELEAYKEVYSSAGGIVFNAFADADLIPGLLSEAAKDFGGKVITEIAKKGALGVAMKQWVESAADHTIVKVINSADSYIMISNTIAKYLLGVDADAVYTAVTNLLVIDPIYRDLIEEICAYEDEDYYMHDSYIYKVKLAAALAQLEYKYCIDIFENDMVIPFNDKKDTIKQVVDMYTEYSNTVTETLDNFIMYIYELREQKSNST